MVILIKKDKRITVKYTYRTDKRLNIEQ